MTGTLNWAAGETGDREIVVPIMPDGIDELPEFLDVELYGAGGGAGLGATVTQVHIAGVSYPAGSIQFGLTSAAMREGDVVEIPVVREEYGFGQVSVTVRISGGTAQLDRDYSGADTTLTWLDGESGPKTVRITASQDQDREDAETITLELSSPTGGSRLGANQQSTVTVVDMTRPRAESGGGHSGALGTILLGLLGWLRRRRGGEGSTG